MSKLRIDKRKFVLSTKKKINPKKRFFVDDTIPNYSCKHTHKDAPDNAVCEDCYSSSGNSDICICSHSKKEHKYNDIEGCSKCPCEYYKTKRLEVTHTGEKTENPDIKKIEAYFLLVECEECAESFHADVTDYRDRIRKQTAEEIFKELDAYFNGDNWNMGITYQKIKKKYLEGLE